MAFIVLTRQGQLIIENIGLTVINNHGCKESNQPSRKAITQSKMDFVLFAAAGAPGTF